VPLSAVADVQLMRGWTPELRRRQEAAGIRILAPGLASGREMVRLLGRNEVLALLVDGNVFRGGIPVELAGRRVLFPAGPARLAGKTGAALMPAFGRRNKDSSLTFTFLREVPAGPDAVRDPAPAMREIARRLEGPLRADPGQWMIFRRFFAGSDLATTEPTTTAVGVRPAGSAA
jgi:lauroyl/myristoyl acyltransferase